MAANISIHVQLCAMAGAGTPTGSLFLTLVLVLGDMQGEAQREAQTTPRACRIKMMKTLPQFSPLRPHSLG